MEGTKGEVIICQNTETELLTQKEKKRTDKQINSIEFLPRVPKLLQLPHTQTASLPSILPHGTVSKPSYQAMILDKWVNFIII